MIRIAAFLIGFLIVSGGLVAQDTLPKFTVTTKGNNRIFISWTNNYSFVSQLSIQRSSDSLRNFKTILTVPDASNLQNGFVDTKAATPYMFYRIFIVFDSGKYVFAPSKRPFWDTARIISKTPKESIQVSNDKRTPNADSAARLETDILRNKSEKKAVPGKEVVKEKPEPERFFTVKRRDSILFQLSEKDFKNFRDSIVYKTKDTMVFRSSDTILLKTYVPKEIFKPSIYIYTQKEGNVTISLPDIPTKKYDIKFFDEKNNPLFDLNHVKENSLLLDKSNFLRAGWYRFELYEDGKLKEKNKFYIPKDF